MRNAEADIFTVNLETKEIMNLTKDKFANYAPTWAPDGKSLVYLVRVSGNEKIFRMNADGTNQTQLTFGTHDDGGPQFLDADTLVFPSTAVNPAEPIDPEVAKNGQIYNLWTLNLKNGELKQYTDALAGNLSARWSCTTAPRTKIAFVTYLKGDYGLHILERKEEITKVASADFGAPGPIVDFQAPLSHTMVADNKKKKGRFEKLFLEGRPPVALGVTSGGDVFGGTQVTFTDVLGDQQFNLFVSSVSQYRTLSLTWVNLEKRLQWAVQGYSQSQFYYGQQAGVFYDPAFSYIVDRDLATATQHPAGRQRLRDLPVQPLPPRRGVGGLPALQRKLQRPGPRAVLAGLPAAAVRPHADEQRQHDAARRGVRPGDDHLPGVRSALGQHHAAGVRHRAQAGQHAVAPDPRRRCAQVSSAWAPRACSRCAPAASRAGAATPATSTSAATPSCAATSTCSSWARTPSSSTPNCASR